MDFSDEIIEIEELGDMEMIDIEVSGNHLFYANGILVKNSMGIPATADFIMFYGSDEENMVYESELFYKIAKNRLGGRVGEIGKFYYDTRSLKLYDVEEFDDWKDDAEISGDNREISPQLDNTQGRRGRR